MCQQQDCRHAKKVVHPQKLQYVKRRQRDCNRTIMCYKLNVQVQNTHSHNTVKSITAILSTRSSCKHALNFVNRTCQRRFEGDSFSLADTASCSWAASTVATWPGTCTYHHRISIINFSTRPRQAPLAWQRRLCFHLMAGRSPGWQKETRPPS